MNIGMVGLGKLGLPVAVAMGLRQHKVMGYDLDINRMGKWPQAYQEAGPTGEGDFNLWLHAAKNLSFGSLEHIALHSEIIFVAVQTPHDSKYEGITPLPDERIDFDYTYLQDAIRALAEVVRKKTVISVISTCLPGTMERDIKPLLNEYMKLVYNPFFIAMGTTMRDFLETEFVLLGAEPEDDGSIALVEKFYKQTTVQPIQTMSIESAELTKVAYNTFISMKIAFANTVMEICEHPSLPKADCNEVLGALQQARMRLISPAYMNGGMGDGGGCHPRDNIALSSLAQSLHLSYDLFEAIMLSRQEQARWKASVVVELATEHLLPIVILGYAFKPGTNLTVGSPALLVAHYIKEIYKTITHHNSCLVYLDGRVTGLEEVGSRINIRAVYLVGCLHPEYRHYQFPEGSIVVDPHRIIPDQEGVRVIRLGEGRIE